MSKHAAPPVGSAAREATAAPYIGKRERPEREPERPAKPPAREDDNEE